MKRIEVSLARKGYAKSYVGFSPRAATLIEDMTLVLKRRHSPARFGD